MAAVDHVPTPPGGSRLDGNETIGAASALAGPAGMVNRAEDVFEIQRQNESAPEYGQDR